MDNDDAASDGGHTSDMITLCELVEEYRQDIANASAELLTLSDELLLSNKKIDEQKIQLFS